MNFDYSTRARTAITFLVIVLLASNLRQLRETAVFDFSFVGKDGISLYEKRFEDLRKLLPPHGVVTYLDDSKGVKETFKAYYLTQYALSPVVLLHPGFSTIFYSEKMLSHKAQFVIENFHDPTRERYLTRLLPGQFAAANRNESGAKVKIATNGESIVLKDFDNGVTLYGDGTK